MKTKTIFSQILLNSELSELEKEHQRQNIKLRMLRWQSFNRGKSTYYIARWCFGTWNMLWGCE
jgi:hypothetical protein